MSCDACVIKIQRALNKFKDIDEATINLEKQTGKINYSSNVPNKSRIINSIEKLGFKARFI